MVSALHRPLIWVASLAIGLAIAPAALAQQPPLKRTAQAWTLEEAQTQLHIYPTDRYLQYVVLQLARREGNLDAVAEQVERIVWGGNAWNSAGRSTQVDLFSILSGKLAVQESLQLDTMRGEARRRQTFNVDQNEEAAVAAKAEKRQKELVPLSKLQGPTIKSHPWEVMLAGKKPAISPLALAVPEDQYYIEFRSVGKLLEILAAGDLYSSYLFNQSSQDATNAATPERINQQLAITPSRFTDIAFEQTVEQAAITGSDLFVNEGSDITFLFRLKEPQAFKLAMDLFLTTAEKSRPDAKRKEGTILGVPYVAVTTPHREISAYSAWPSPELHVRSNSLVGLTRVLSTLKGKDASGQPAKPLGATAEFAYIRTLMPQGAKEEDVLVYLSDPFIRRMTGPQVKIVERRRQLAHNHLRMIGHASLMYRTEFGQMPASLPALVSAKCAPGTFGEGELAVPGGADYALSADGTAGVSSKYGQAAFLTPICEMPITEVTGEEADLYDAFLKDYNQYWRTFFDPIAIRVQVTPQKYRMETIILPLIDNTLYSGLSQALGGKAEPLDALPIPKRNIATINFRLNKDRWANEITESSSQVPWVLREMAGGSKEVPALDVKDFVLNGLGNQIGLNVYDGPRTFEFNFSGFLGQMMGSFSGRSMWGNFGGETLPIAMAVGSLNAPVYISIPVKDPKIVDKFLMALDPVEAMLSRQREQGGWFRVDNDYYQLPAAGDAPVIRCHAVSLGPIKWRFFWARIDNGLYIASKKFILDDLVVAHVARRKPKPDAMPEDMGPAAHAMVRLRPSQWREIRPEFELGWSENSRKASTNNLSPLSNVARALAARPAPVGGAKPTAEAQMAEIQRVAEQVYGVRFTCPEGGKYEVAGDGQSVVSDLFGGPLTPKQPPAPSKAGQVGRLLADLWQVTAELTFLEDGLHAVLTVDRTAPKLPAP